MPARVTPSSDAPPSGILEQNHWRTASETSLTWPIRRDLRWSMLRRMGIRIGRSAALRLLVPVLSALTMSAAALSGAQAPTAAPARPAMYTEAQATLGESLYRQSCAACHGATLTGGTAPPLAGPALEPG